MAYQPSYGQRGQPPGSGRGGGDGDVELERLLKPSGTITYFADEPKKGHRPTVRAELLDGEAQSVAKAINTLPASQLRRFYASVISLKRELEVNPGGTPDALVLARLALLKAHTAYAKKRIKEMPDEFVHFVVRHVAAVKTKEDFLYGFAPCFEAVVAYHKLFEVKKG